MSLLLFTGVCLLGSAEYVFSSTNIVDILLKLRYINEKYFKYLVKQRVKCLSSSGGHNNCNLPLLEF